MKQTLIKLISSTLLLFITSQYQYPHSYLSFRQTMLCSPNQQLRPLKHFVELAQLVSTGSLFSSQQPRYTLSRKTIDSLLMNSWSLSNNLNPSKLQQTVSLHSTHHGVSVEGHDDAGHTEVRHRQGDDEVVGDVL